MTLASDALLREIRDGLEGVGRGPWRARDNLVYLGDAGGFLVHSDILDGNAIKTAAHLARSSPDNWRAVLARLERAEKLVAAVERYLSEHDNPAPDYAYRHRLREDMRAVLKGE